MKASFIRAIGAVAGTAIALGLCAGTALAVDVTIHLYAEDFVQGLQQPDEIDLAGWSIELRDSGDQVIGTEVTDADGDAFFVVPGPGTYATYWTPPSPYPYDPDSSWAAPPLSFEVPDGAVIFNDIISLGCGCNDGDFCTVDSCKNGICSAVLQARPDVPDRCDGLDNDCDGDTDEGLPVPCNGDPTEIGCADGTREGFMAFALYPLIASCAGAWDTPDPNTDPQCMHAAGNHGFIPDGTGCAPADLCPAGWHVCYGPDDVAERVGMDGCTDAVDPEYPNLGQGPLADDVSLPPGGAFFASRARTQGGACVDGVNTPMDPPDAVAEIAIDNVFGCGNMGAVPTIGCGDLDRAAGTLCAGLQDALVDAADRPATDYGYATAADWAWACGTIAGEELANLVKTLTNQQGGVLCCRDVDPTLPEVCDGIDNDDDGQTDEGVWATVAVVPGDSCVAGEQCGDTVCTAAGGWDCIDLGPCDDPTCDDIDDDDDGDTDEDYESSATTCGMGVCLASGELICVDGGETDTCTPGARDEEQDTTCDSLDGDCDGDTDEEFQPYESTCGQGVCARVGTVTCSEGGEVDDCEPGVAQTNTDPTCDGVDEDCDGADAEDFTGAPTTCGDGVCARTGAIVCVDGSEDDTCVPGTPTLTVDDTCNGLDEDCDGSDDDDWTDEASSCGFGACQRDGLVTCVNDSPSDSCVPGLPLDSDDDTCDNVDDDCDNQTDEDVPSGPSTCGEGVCARTGTIGCVGGATLDTCVPGNPISGTDLTCDGVDDDCDGETDESYSATATTCGEGVCARTGELRCVDGGEVDSCAPGQPLLAVDDNCNGLDDDCDGETDEGYVATATTCGAGQCAGAGTLSCVDGVEVDSCAPAAAPSSDDTTCDNVDDDCDGLTDDDYVPTTTTCGIGACAANSGELRCVDGGQVDTCEPLGGATDEICNGEDDDCDGDTDEEFPELGRACDGDDADECDQGVWACGAGGDVVCEEAGPQRIELCNGVDDDCDSLIDEGFSDVACPDRDRDLKPDPVDNCPDVPNFDQLDSNDDGKGDACDTYLEGGACAGGGGDSAPWLLVVMLGFVVALRRRRRVA